MSKARYRVVHFGGSADEVESAFYEALQSGQVDQIMACWADEEDIVCVHPGGPRLVGALAIRTSFEEMLAHGVVRAYPERLRRIDSLGAAVHSVLERIDMVTAEGVQHAWVVSTNVYLKTALGWRLVARHASASRSEVAESAPPSQPLH
ncbi:YybH family protein [Ottowia sp.]|uniref:YybH family protein n=1 Tax=Ottowia sp. TaxID=1898956 RepID=UPI003A851100